MHTHTSLPIGDGERLSTNVLMTFEVVDATQLSRVEYSCRGERITRLLRETWNRSDSASRVHGIKGISPPAGNKRHKCRHSENVLR